MGIFSQFSRLTGEWVVGSFVSATLDYFFNIKVSHSHLLNTVSAIMQLTLATVITNEMMYYTGQRRSNQLVTSTWFLPAIIWGMSPRAVQKLKNSYYAFHVFLYGASSAPPEEELSVGSSSPCACKDK